ncbi:hypothetical protein SSX86_020536 [Deinandra increscens subsp. villosa]|uniref:Uncharacterized protein n=1 Tax=Deinandra increscens subsp. villosa TaxID=3103831 RepID=A0AAP0GTB4_9ASTR
MDPKHQDLDPADNGENNGEKMLNYEPDPFCCMDNDPPESYAVCRSKVSDWLNRTSLIERNPSVKFACSKTQDPSQTQTQIQTQSGRRSVSITHGPKLSIIGFRKKPVRQTDGKAKHYDRVESVRLFRNRSEPGRDYCLLITEPVSPRVSCAGRVGSVRVVEKRKGGVWRSFKAAFLNLVQTNRVAKIGG